MDATGATDEPQLHMPRPIRAGEVHDAHRLLDGSHHSRHGAAAGPSGSFTSDQPAQGPRRRKTSQASRTSRHLALDERLPPPYSAEERLLPNGRGYPSSGPGERAKASPSKRSEASRMSNSHISLTSTNLRLHEAARQPSSAYRGHLSVEQVPPRRKAPSRGAASAASSILSAATLPQSASFAAAALALQKERTRGSTATEHASLIKRFLRHAERTGRSRRTTTAVVVAVVVLVKWTVGLGGYSGYGTGPLFGDLEAQRHWMGLTLHRPISEWYFYDLEYWGLDYPPLTAYHSLLLGYVGRFLNPSFVSLRPPSLTTSADGWADLHSDLKNFLRGTVVISELLTWIPAVLLYRALVLGRPSAAASNGETAKRRSWRTQMGAATMLLLHPALILVDNGHFQYNSVMLALTLGAIICFNLGRDVLGAVLFVCSMGYKQMALYYAPAIFAYLFGKCLYLPTTQGLSLFIHLALVSTATLALIFLPFLFPPSFPAGILQALHRIFPLARGLFEDKVANVWCALNVVVKLRELAGPAALARLALVATASAVLPGTAAMIWTSWSLGRVDAVTAPPAPRESRAGRSATPPTARLLPHALFVSSMAFFLFSFQAHEKSVLLPLMPLGLVAAGKEPNQRGRDWEWSVLVGNVGVFSMWPLLKRDGLGSQYFALTFLYNYAIGHNPFRTTRSFVKVLSLATYALALLLHLVEALRDPPPHLPDLFGVLNLTLSCAVFGLAWLWGLKRQLQEGWALVGPGGFGFGESATAGAPGGRGGAGSTGGVPRRIRRGDRAPTIDAALR